MGRVKLKIKRLESTGNRQVTYTKRKSGILKKARELSILCDIDIVLLMFSPTGKPTAFHGDHRFYSITFSKFLSLSSSFILCHFVCVLCIVLSSRCYIILGFTDFGLGTHRVVIRI